MLQFVLSVLIGLIGGTVFQIRIEFFTAGQSSSVSLLLSQVLFVLTIISSQLGVYHFNKNTSKDSSIIWAGFVCALMFFTFAILIDHTFRSRVFDFGLISTGFIIFGFSGMIISWILSFLYPKTNYRNTRSDILDDYLD